jgi:hypothetical protein
MDMAMAGFAVYVLLQMETGVPLYSTTALPEEITAANASLEAYGNSCRFVPKSSLSHSSTN